MSISLREQFGDDAEWVKEILLMFSSVDPVTGVSKRDARIVSIGPEATCQELRDMGMARAQMAQDGRSPGWGDIAFNAVRKFCKEHPTARFKTEVVRIWAEEIEYIVPARNLRAWGPVILKAAREGLIRAVGYEKTNNPTAHNTPATLWAVA
jgi:hypothetical protein